MSLHTHKKRKARVVSKEKAKEIMRHGEVKGHALSEKQKGLFGMIAGGGTPTRLKKKRIAIRRKKR
ncbi:MAG: hypothetical protein AABY15_08700 [Nanoarchaeota archaeon]